MNGRRQGSGGVLERLLTALNSQDLDGLVGCFAENYLNETPVHPQRGFRGRAQVRDNWSQIFASVTGLSASTPRVAAHGDMLWTEWDMVGQRKAGGTLRMRGVVIFTVADDVITAARFYLEPVEETSGDVNAYTRRLLDDTMERQGTA